MEHEHNLDGPRQIYEAELNVELVHLKATISLTGRYQQNKKDKKQSLLWIWKHVGQDPVSYRFAAGRAFGAFFATTAGGEEEDEATGEKKDSSSKGSWRRRRPLSRKRTVRRHQHVEEASSIMDADEMDLAGGGEVRPAAGGAREIVGSGAGRGGDVSARWWRLGFHRVGEKVTRL
jgi:hypothetical protein